MILPSREDFRKFMRIHKPAGFAACSLKKLSRLLVEVYPEVIEEENESY